MPDRAGRMGIEVRHLPVRRLYRTVNPVRLLGGAGHVALAVRRIRKLVKAEQVSIIHSNSSTAQIYGAPAGRLSGVPSVWHARDLVPLGWLGGVLCGLSSHVIAISLDVARCLTPSARTAAKISVVHNGIDAESFRRHARPGKIRAELGLSEERNVVAMVGQIVPWKGHRTFIRALAQLPGAVGLIVGEDLFGDHADLLQSLHDLCLALHVEDRVRFLGWRSDVNDILLDSDVLAVPSVAEPFGRVALEAMALGKPVVGTLAGGLPEVVVPGETGILVPPNDADRLAEGIRALLDDPQRAEAMGRAGLERVRSSFSTAQCARAVEDIYQQLLR